MGGKLARSGKPSSALYLYLHADAVREHSGVGRVEGLGPVLAAEVREWGDQSDATIKPVIDLADVTSGDAYEGPDGMSPEDEWWLDLHDARCRAPPVEVSV
jgi:hypothetical protein